MKTYEVKFRRSFFTKKYRWRVRADNGRIIGASTQSYHNRKDCEQNARLLGNSLTNF